jgi:hypothetical protein
MRFLTLGMVEGSKPEDRQPVQPDLKNSHDVKKAPR